MRTNWDESMLKLGTVGDAAGLRGLGGRGGGVSCAGDGVEEEDAAEEEVDIDGPKAARREYFPCAVRGALQENCRDLVNF